MSADLSKLGIRSRADAAGGICAFKVVSVKMKRQSAMSETPGFVIRSEWMIRSKWMIRIECIVSILLFEFAVGFGET